MKVHIREGLHDEAVAEVPQLRVLQPLRHMVGHGGDDAVLQHQAAVLQNIQPPHLRRMDDVALQYLRHIENLLQAK